MNEKDKTGLTAKSPEAETEAPLGDYTQISRKIRRSRIRKDRIARWGKLGGLIGGICWVLFCVALQVESITRERNGPLQHDEKWGVFAIILFVGLTLAVPVAAIAGMGVASLVETLRPIMLAIVDAKKYEQEYGASGALPERSKHDQAGSVSTVPSTDSPE